MAFVGHFWSGKHHRVVKEINLITLYYTDPQGKHQQINYRIYDKLENKTKSDYFQEMLTEVSAWSLEPAFVTGDSWYSSLNNLKMIKNHHPGFLFALESNRLASIEKEQWSQVQQLTIPKDGLCACLRGFGTVKVFRTWLKNQPRHYALYQSNDDHWGLLIMPRFSSSMTRTGKSSSTIEPSSKFATLSIFRFANRRPFGTISSRRSIVMYNCSDYGSPM